MNPIYPNALAVPAKTTSAKFIVFSVVLALIGQFADAQQAVTGIITDYNSYWKSSSTSVNPLKPANNHNVLAFTYNGTQYSTGVNDSKLAAKGESFVSGDFWSLPVEGFTGRLNSNTKVGLGQMADGVDNGPSAVAPDYGIDTYLTDGIKGLNIGTCVANLPKGNLTFVISNVRPESIGDGIPDILVTQVADPSGSHDNYSFLDGSGNIIGHSKDIVFTAIAPVANWTADFYQADVRPMVLAGGFTNTDRPMRLWAADLSDFGITVANYTSIRKFLVDLSGNSDVAFAAYNSKTFNVGIILPVKLIDFKAAIVNNNTEIKWSTSSEVNSKYFVVERSSENGVFTAIDTLEAAGYSADITSYSITDRSPLNGSNYYRLHTIDNGGKSEYSKTVVVKYTLKEISIGIYPNPATDRITIEHPSKTQAKISLINNQGLVVKEILTTRSADKTIIELGKFAKGVYHLVWQTENERSSRSVVIR
jgi:hypothetical protein